MYCSACLCSHVHNLHSEWPKLKSSLIPGTFNSECYEESFEHWTHSFLLELHVVCNMMFTLVPAQNTSQYRQSQTDTLHWACCYDCSKAYIPPNHVILLRQKSLFISRRILDGLHFPTKPYFRIQLDGMQVGVYIATFSDSSELFVKLATCSNHCHPMILSIIPMVTVLVSRIY